MERVFKTAFSIGKQAKNIDKTLDTLAADYGMTDMRNDMGSVMESMRRGQADFNPKWGKMESNVGAALGGVPATDAVSPLREGGILEAPRAVPLSSKHIDRTPLSSVRVAE